MRKLILIINLAILSMALTGQVSMDMALMANVDSTNLTYSDCWGYVHNGQEYAVITSRTSIIIYDVTDCANPTKVYAKNGLDNTIWRDCKDYGNYVYCVDDDNHPDGMWIINKTTLTETMHNPSSGRFRKSHNIFIDSAQARLYVVGSNGSPPNNLGVDNIGIYDLAANPANPPLLANVNLLNIGGGSVEDYYIHDIYVKDHIGYASHGYDGLRIWDFTDVNNVQLLGAYPLAGQYNHSSWLHPDGNTLYVAYEVPAGLPMRILDVSDPTNPFSIGTFQDPLLAVNNGATNVTPHNPFVKEDRLYISYYEDGVKIYDVSNPTMPAVTAYYDTYSNSSYAGTRGNWGIYPFLPSGCLVANDISTGMYLLKERRPPESLIEINDDLLIDVDNTNFVLQNIFEDTYELEINTATNKVSAVPSSNATIGAEGLNADLYLNSNGSSIVLKQGGSYYRLQVDNGGGLFTQPLLTPPNSASKLSNGAISLSTYMGGFILKDTNGQCWKSYIDDFGSLVTTDIICP